MAYHAARATSDLDDIGPRTPQLEHVTAILWLLQVLILQSELPQNGQGAIELFIFYSTRFVNRPCPLPVVLVEVFNDVPHF